MKKIIFLYFFVFFGCSSKNSDSQAILWTKSMCCDLSESLSINGLNVNPQNSIEISFCEGIDSVVSLKLITLKNSQQEILIDLLGGISLQNQKLIIEVNEKPKNTRGIFNFNEILHDGNYYLFIATSSLCGDIRFNLSNGKKTRERLTCIEYCDSTLKNY